MLAVPRNVPWIAILAVVVGSCSSLRARDSGPAAPREFKLLPGQQPVLGGSASTVATEEPDYRRLAAAIEPNPFTNEALARGRAVQNASGSVLDTAADHIAGFRLAPSIPAKFPSRAPPASTPKTSPFPADAMSGKAQERPVSWSLLVPNFLEDQKQIWLFPLGLAKGQHWVPTIPIVAATGGLVVLDPFVTPYFRTSDEFKTFDRVFSPTNTERVFLGLPVVWYLGGLATHSRYTRETGFLAGETLADAELLTAIMQSVTGRIRPRNIPLPENGGDYTHTWFKTNGGFPRGGGFPSGHAAGAFSVATVFARRYGRKHRWVPWVSYSLATVTGFSRVTWSAHFPSDVFLGAALAYVIGRYVVLRNAEEPLDDESSVASAP